MRRILTTIAVVVLTAGLAFSYGGFRDGRGFGSCYDGDGGYGRGGGYGMMRGGGYNYNTDAKALTEDEVKIKVQEYIKDYKGYTVVEVKKFEMPRGTMFEFKLNDAGGNTFYIHVNPWGYIRGPFDAAK